MKKFTLELGYLPKGTETRFGEVSRILFNVAPATDQAVLSILVAREFDGRVRPWGIEILHGNAEIARLVWVAG